MQNFSQFKKTVWTYYRKHGRHDLPWRNLPIDKEGIQDPYKILVSELMLQQTPVSRVIQKYFEFIKQFPNFKTLARASVSDVLKAWQGLGYNRRALYLKRTAEIVTEKYKGILPKDPQALISLPGIGPNTAGAICAYSFNIPSSFIETNIRKVFIHHFFKGRKGNITDEEILELVSKTKDQKIPREWYSALMDYGTYLCKHIENPNHKSKHYVKQLKFKGSNRQLRGKILKMLLVKNVLSEKEILEALQEEPARIKKIIQTLVHDKFIKIRKGKVSEILTWVR